MRRLSLLLALLLITASASALTSRRPAIALLDLAPRYEMRVDAFGAMRDSLKAALSRHGFDAYNTAERYEELERFKSGNADYYLEIIGSEREAHSNGGGGVGVGPLDVGVETVKNRHFLEVRVYDGHSLEVLRTYQLDASSTSLVPSLLGVRGYNFFVSLFLAPWSDRAHAQRAIDAVAGEAAWRITRDMTEHQQRQ
jgi:hypothetical protein